MPESRVKRLRIGMALDTLHRYGGLTRSAWEMSQHLAEHHEVIFFTTEAELSGNEKFKVELISVPNIPYVKRLIFAWRVSLQKKKHALDILHVHGSNGFWQDVVTAHSVHKKWFFWSLKQTKFLSLPFFKKLFNPIHYLTIAIEQFQYSTIGTKRIIAISNQVKGDLLQYFGMNPSRIAVVYHGVNTTEFDPAKRQQSRAALRKQQNISDHQLVIIFAAHEFRRKGLSVVLDALAKIQDKSAVLLVAGQGDPEPFMPQIEALALSQRVRFLGRQHNMGEWFAASDIFAFPTSYEAFGLVITEAMAAGLPVITPKDAGAAELITHSVDGYLMSEWNRVDELVAGINHLSNADIRKSMGDNARSKAESWTWAQNARELDEVYRYIVQR